MAFVTIGFAYISVYNNLSEEVHQKIAAVDHSPAGLVWIDIAVIPHC